MPNNSNNTCMFCCTHLERSLYVTCWILSEWKPNRTASHQNNPSSHRCLRGRINRSASGNCSPLRSPPNVTKQKVFCSASFDSKLLTSVSLSKKWVRKKSFVICNLRWMNLNISCYRCGRATCGRVWRIALVWSAVWGNRWNNPVSASLDTDIVTREIVCGGAADGRYYRSCDRKSYAASTCSQNSCSIDRGLVEECCTSFPADWQIECKEDGVERLEKAPCETNIALYTGLNNQWERR
jgi:hypothetical protein